ncbi:WD40 repeat protein [Litorimonas taeanensis]|uniref:WD40 repeat protein n=1 Tax=Litorimonas taeanensis TaxID=568099 RepID=A0A420WF33_9PROT|nr:PD40 domain-containing protein [Litorimonas taeanensis]RKQ69598.1 WD40 repeat protein [Litorimonas taeanensis]
MGFAARYMSAVMAGLSVLAVQSVTASAQSAPREKASFPETEIFLFDLKLGDTVSIANGRNVTLRAGYDNQPSFTPDSRAFLYARSDDFQTDIYEYSLVDGTTRQITRTETNEFSPVATPDNASISFVSDGPGAWQTVEVIARNNPEISKRLLPGDTLREPIGYYSWNHATDDVLYWSRYGFNISLTHKDKKTSDYITGDAVPSTPYVIPGTNQFSFVHRQGNESVWIKALDPKTKSVRPLTPIKGTNANYGWSPEGSIFIIEKDTLYRWKEGPSDGWESLADLTEYGLVNAARLSISPDGKKLAIVGQVKP